MVKGFGATLVITSKPANGKTLSETPDFSAKMSSQAATRVPP